MSKSAIKINLIFGSRNGIVPKLIAQEWWTLNTLLVRKWACAKKFSLPFLKLKLFLFATEIKHLTVYLASLPMDNFFVVYLWIWWVPEINLLSYLIWGQTLTLWLTLCLILLIFAIECRRLFKPLFGHILASDFVLVYDGLNDHPILHLWRHVLLTSATKLLNRLVWPTIGASTLVLNSNCKITVHFVILRNWIGINAILAQRINILLRVHKTSI